MKATRHPYAIKNQCRAETQRNVACKLPNSQSASEKEDETRYFIAIIWGKFRNIPYIHNAYFIQVRCPSVSVFSAVESDTGLLYSQ